MSIFDDGPGLAALERVGFSLDESGDYPLVQRYGPMGSALAEVIVCVVHDKPIDRSFIREMETRGEEGKDATTGKII